MRIQANILTWSKFNKSLHGLGPWLSRIPCSCNDQGLYHLFITACEISMELASAQKNTREPTTTCGIYSFRVHIGRQGNIATTTFARAAF
jgi:hypothetical protein